MAPSDPPASRKDTVAEKATFFFSEKMTKMNMLSSKKNILQIRSNNLSEDLKH